jgi:hypothetical protein
MKEALINMVAAVKLGSYSVKISAGTPVILPEVFRDFPQSLKACAGIVLD